MIIKDGCRRPHLSTEWNHFRADTTKILGEHLRQVSKKSDQWLGGDAITRKKFMDERTDGWTADGTQKNRNLAAESYPGCYGIAGFKACKTNFSSAG